MQFYLSDRVSTHHQPDLKNLSGTEAAVGTERTSGRGDFLVPAGELAGAERKFRVFSVEEPLMFQC